MQNRTGTQCINIFCLIFFLSQKIDDDIFWYITLICLIVLKVFIQMEITDRIKHIYEKNYLNSFTIVRFCSVQSALQIKEQSTFNPVLF